MTDSSDIELLKAIQSTLDEIRSILILANLSSSKLGYVSYTTNINP